MANFQFRINDQSPALGRKGWKPVEVRDYLSIFLKRKLSILIVALLSLAAAAAITLSMTPQYTATTTMFFGVQGGESVTDLTQGSAFTEKQMSSYVQVATSPIVLEPVIKKLGLNVTSETLAASVGAAVSADTAILAISVTNPDPQLAARIANAVGAQVGTVAGSLFPERPDGSEAVRATTLARARVPTEASSPRVARNLALGLIAGLVLGAAVALLRHATDTKIRGQRDVQTVTDSAVLGIVPFDAAAPTHPVVMRDDPLGARSEAVRRLRTNLQFVDVADQAKSIVITSSISGEGKTTTAINLAVSLADAGLRVVLVDADLRRPSIAEYLGLEGRVGLTTVLIGRAQIHDVIQPWQQGSLDILPSGQIPPNPSELLGSKAMGALLDQLTEAYDMVLLDSPPLLPVTDAAVLSKFTGGTLVVVGADRIHRAQLRDALESLTTVGANIQGLVLNKIARRDSSAYVYEAGYASEQEVVAPRSSVSPKYAHRDEADLPTAVRSKSRVAD